LPAAETNALASLKIGALEATNHYDQTMIVTGKVVQVTIRPSVTFLNLDRTFPNSPFAVVIISGLITAVAVTLVVLPFVYSLLLLLPAVAPAGARALFPPEADLEDLAVAPLEVGFPEALGEDFGDLAVSRCERLEPARDSDLVPVHARAV
jgi:hypothetical protein